MSTYSWAHTAAGRAALPLIVALATLAGGCGEAPDCRTPNITVHPDLDGDGYGDRAAPELVCAVAEGYVENSGDCDDTNDRVYNGALELCDEIDNDCDQVVDNDLSFAEYWPDADGDGAGDLEAEGVWTCDPAPGHVAAGGDCNDADPGIHPNAPELCDLVDNDCDNLVDDADDNVDLTGAATWYGDADKDGYGNPDVAKTACEQPANTVATGDDCNDAVSAIHPGALERCDGKDNDCDTLIDDADPSIDPNEQQTYYLDSDLDKLGDPTVSVEACTPPANHVLNGDDCDDMDILKLGPTDWYADADLDGYGGGPAVELDVCWPTDPALLDDATGLDCNDAEIDVHPGAEEICGDGIDNDCSGADAVCPLPATCQAWLLDDPAAASGVYQIEPNPGEIRDVWCDMQTDGGGWTLVGSSFDRPLSDASAGYHNELKTLTPANSRPGVWNGLRNAVVGAADLRFTCKELVGDTDMTVDLSVYNVAWYHEFTAGAEGASCFSEGDGAGYEQPAPARRDNLTGAVRGAGDDWNAGYLEGEDACNDAASFTIDFDDRGKDGDESDGTDWGADDGVAKCGVAGSGEAWFLWVRPLTK